MALVDLIDKYDFDDNSDLLNHINTCCIEASNLRGKIADLQKANSNKSSSSEFVYIPSSSVINSDSSCSSNYFDDILSLYFGDLSLIDNMSIEKIVLNLPNPNHIHYSLLIKKIILILLKFINEFYSIMNSSGCSDEDKDVCLDFIKKNRLKIDSLNKLLRKEAFITNEDSNESNQNIVVLMPKKDSGMIYSLSDIKNIDDGCYNTIFNLIKSIIDGTFKNVKHLCIGDNKGIYEVKDGNIRVVFNRLSYNTFAILYIFQKKVTNDAYVRSSLSLRAEQFKHIRSFLVDSLNNPEFMKNNEFYVYELFNKLGVSNENAKKLVKRGEIYG